jgi:hypothetical protein
MNDNSRLDWHRIASHRIASHRIRTSDRCGQGVRQTKVLLALQQDAAAVPGPRRTTDGKVRLCAWKKTGDKVSALRREI